MICFQYPLLWIIWKTHSLSVIVAASYLISLTAQKKSFLSLEYLFPAAFSKSKHHNWFWMQMSRCTCQKPHFLTNLKSEFTLGLRTESANKNKEELLRALDLDVRPFRGFGALDTSLHNLANSYKQRALGLSFMLPSCGQGNY